MAKLRSRFPLDETTNDLPRRLSGLNPLSLQGLVHWVDILLVTLLFFLTFRLIRGKQAWRIITGTGIFIGALFVTEQLKLNTLHFLLDKATLLAPVALAILLLPELRQALEGLARLDVWSDLLLPTGRPATSPALDELINAIGTMAEKHTGALIVIEGQAHLDETIATGVRIDATLSSSLLEAIFFGENPLHDGAAILRGDKVVAAACRLPLSESTAVAKHMHMRHRAGLGASEASDCVVIVVSEERGRISVAFEGRMTEIRSLAELRDRLNEAYGLNPRPRKPISKRKAG